MTEGSSVRAASFSCKMHDREDLRGSQLKAINFQYLGTRFILLALLHYKMLHLSNVKKMTAGIF